MGDGDDLILNDGVMAATEALTWVPAMTWSGLEVNAFRQMANSVNASRLTMVSLLMEVLDAIRSNSVIQVFRVIPFGVDASQPSSFSLQLINADVISDRFVNFENLIQGEGRYQYEGDFSSNFESVVVRNGVFVASEKSPATFENLVLESDGTIIVGMINSGSDGDDQAPIVVTGEKGFVYSSGSFVISADQQDDPEGSYFVIQGNVIMLLGCCQCVTCV